MLPYQLLICSQLATITQTVDLMHRSVNAKCRAIEVLRAFDQFLTPVIRFAEIGTSHYYYQQLLNHTTLG